MVDSPPGTGGPSGLVRMAALIVVAAGLRAFSAQLGPLFLGLVVVIAVAPIRTGLMRRGWPSWAGMLASMAAAYGTLLIMVLALLWSGSQLAQLLSSDEYTQSMIELRDDVEQLATDFGIDTEAIGSDLNDVINVDSVLSSIQIALGQAASLGSVISLLVVVVFFMVVDTPSFARQLHRLGRERPAVEHALDGFATRTRSYLWVSTLFGALVALLDGTALWLLGVPLVWVWVLVSFLTNFIPNIGFVLGLIPPAIVALFDGGLRTAIGVVVIYAALNFGIQTLIQPRVVGDSAGLSTTLTFVSLIFWSFVLGPLGAFLAIPLTLLAKALLVDIDPGARWIEPLISLADEPRAPVPEPIPDDLV